MTSQISKKGHQREILKACDQADIIIQILDARDPEGSRSDQIDELAAEKGKKLIYVINKIDLIPEANLKEWLKYYKSQKLLCLPFRGNLFIDTTKDQEMKTEEAEPKVELNEELKLNEDRKEKIMTMLFKYQRKFAEKQEKQRIGIAIVGYANAGKSSFINTLGNKIITPSSSQAFLTKKLLQISLNRGMVMLDTPGIIHQADSSRPGDDNKKTGTRVIRSALQLEDIADAMGPLQSVMEKVQKAELLRHYRIGDFETAQQLCEEVAKKKGFLTVEEVEVPQVKGQKQQKKQRNHIPNVDLAARRIIRDFLGNKLIYYSALPTK